MTASRAGTRSRLAAVCLGIATVAGCAAVSEDHPGRLLAQSGTGSAVPRSDDGLHGTLVEGAPVGRPALVLPDTSGRRVDLRRRPPGELTVLVFGYTNCPDVCPTTLGDLAAARRIMTPSARPRMQVIFVSEDPGRDAPAAVRDWLDQFDSTFIGLIGGNDASRRAQQALYLPESSRPALPTDASHTGGAADQEYAVDHSGIVYAFAPGGRTVIYTGGTDPDGYAEDFTRLVSGA